MWVIELDLQCCPRQKSFMVPVSCRYSLVTCASTHRTTGLNHLNAATRLERYQLTELCFLALYVADLFSHLSTSRPQGTISTSNFSRMEFDLWHLGNNLGNSLEESSLNSYRDTREKKGMAVSHYSRDIESDNSMSRSTLLQPDLLKGPDSHANEVCLAAS